MKNNIQIIGFDADDTLWVNEPLFRDTEARFSQMLEKFLPAEQIEKELYRIEIQNLGIYGYGIKSFVLSMLETAVQLIGNQLTAREVDAILRIGKNMLNQPLQLIENVETVLQQLSRNYQLIVATKGDLLDQEMKLEKSGLSGYFHHIEIMSNKEEKNYRKLMKRLAIEPQHFMMIGNSMKSDILPVVSIGGQAIHIPFSTTWQHEEVKHNPVAGKYHTVNEITEVLPLL